MEGTYLQIVEKLYIFKVSVKFQKNLTLPRLRPNLSFFDIERISDISDRQPCIKFRKSQKVLNHSTLLCVLSTQRAITAPAANIIIYVLYVHCTILLNGQNTRFFYFMFFFFIVTKIWRIYHLNLIVAI